MLQFVNTVAIARQMPAQPFEAGRIGHIAANAKEIAAAANKIGCVEDRLELRNHVAQRFVLVRSRPFVIEEFVAEFRPRRRSPAGSSSEIVLEQFPVGMRLEVSRPPRHGSFNDFVADDKESIAGTRHTIPLRAPERRASPDSEIHGVRPLHGDALGLKELNKAFQLPTGSIHHNARIAVTAEQTVELSCQGRNGPSDGDVAGRHHCTFQAADDNFFQRVPLVKRANRACARG